MFSSASKASVGFSEATLSHDESQGSLRAPGAPNAAAPSQSPRRSVASTRTSPQLETVEVGVPRGLRIAGSPRLAGQIRGPNNQHVPVRSYAITVETNGRTKTAKEALRESCKRLMEPDWDLEHSLVSDHADEGPMVETMVESFAQRRQRARRFQVGCHFPALVGPRMVSPPGLRNTQSQSSADFDPLQPEVRLWQSTFAFAGKSRTCQQKEIERPAAPWIASGAASARVNISDRKPTLFEDKYDSLRNAQREAYNKAKERWLGGSTILPPSRADAKVTCDTRSPGLGTHIAAVRERGRALNDTLRERYDAKRLTFQKEREARGPLSNFERSRLRKEEEAEEQRKALELQQLLKAEANKEPAPNAMASLGRGNFRASQARPGNSFHRRDSE